MDDRFSAMTPDPKMDRQTAGQAAADRWTRRTLGLARALMIYGLLFGGAMVFSLPFIWMVGTSFKVDREMFGESITLFPMRPVPSAVSPYLDDQYFAVPDSERFDRVQAAIRSAIQRHEVQVPEYIHGRESLVDIILPGIYRRLVQTMPSALWELPDPDLWAEIQTRVTAELISDTAQRVTRRLTFGAIRVRSFELQEMDLAEGRALSDIWAIEGPARWQDGEAVADLVYDFRDEPGALTLSTTLALPFDANRLYRMMLFIRPDDSWHRVNFALEKNGHRYEGMRSEFLGNFQWGAVILKQYGPDDQSTKIRNWLPYRRVASGPEFESRPQHVRVEISMEQAGQRDAWWAKMQANYRDALDHIPFWRYTATSLFLVIMNIVGNIISCSLVAYAFARLQWPGRNLSFGVMLATLMIPPQVTMIPHFLIIRSLGWYNTLYPLWVISFFGNAFNIFLLRQFMKGIPRDLEDAAKIDGCNFLQVYWYVIMPLIKPTLACISIFTFMMVWNDFMGPLIYLSDQRLYPLSLGLYAFNVQAGGNLGMMMAGSLMMTLPVIVIFFFAQKYFIQGVTLTGMKG